MSATPQFDDLLAEVQAAADAQPNKDAIEHVVLRLFRKAKANLKIAVELERVYPKLAAGRVTLAK